MRVVTIDGPAGAGKSTVARMLAEQLGWRLLDTGAMYRAVTYAALKDHIQLNDPEALGDLADRVHVQFSAGHAFLEGEDVTSMIRSVDVTRASRYLADAPRVRSRLVIWQREYATQHNVIAEGRDQGTLVFPDALHKVFLTASLDECARRRHAEYQERGESISFESVCEDLRRRDEHDETRAIAPMKPANDARILDTTGLSLEEVVSTIECEVRSKLHTRHASSIAARS